MGMGGVAHVHAHPCRPRRLLYLDRESCPHQRGLAVPGRTGSSSSRIMSRAPLCAYRKTGSYGVAVLSGRSLSFLAPRGGKPDHEPESGVASAAPLSTCSPCSVSLAWALSSETATGAPAPGSGPLEMAAAGRWRPNHSEWLSDSAPSSNIEPLRD